MTTLRPRWSGAVLLIVLAAPAAAQNNRQSAVDKVLADWKARQTAVDAIRYVAVGKKIAPAGALTDDYGNPRPGTKDLVVEKPLMLHLNLTNNQYRFEDREQRRKPGTTDEMVPGAYIGAFDGNKYRVFAPRAENSGPGYEMAKDRPDLSEVTGDMRRQPFFIELHPLFYGLGIVSVHDDTIYPGHFRREYDPVMFLFHAEGVLDGRRCVVVRTRPEIAGLNTFVEEYWVDPARQSAILRHTTVRDGEPFLDVRTEQQQTTHGWFPKRWEATLFGKGKAVQSIGRYEIREIEFNRPPSADELRFDVQPGMLVAKLTHRSMDERVPVGEQPPNTVTETFRVGEGGDLNEETNPASARFGPKWIWRASAAAVVGAAAGGLIVWRRRGRRAAA
jgi:hypothetical protein